MFSLSLCALAWLAWLQAAPAGSSNLGLLMILAVFAIFYFLLIMPVQRRQKRMQKMLRELKTGDRVITSGGLRGTIVSLKDDSLQLRIAPDQVKLEFVRAAVAQVVDDEAAAKTAK
ncbi:MAG TPA: preprotein translocase subunit YajC [Terriglobales bacterium]